MTDQSVKQRESDFFDAFVEKNGDFNPFKERGWQTLNRRFREMVGHGAPAKSLDLLDVGCGTGRSQQIYSELVRTYTGLDLSEKELNVGRKRMPEHRWVRGDGCMLPFADASFDAVCFSAVLHHIPDFSPALREAIRVLRPGGHVFAFDPNLLHPAMALLRSPKSPLYSLNGVSPNERPLWPSHLRREFAAAGIVDIRQRCQGDIPYRAVAPKLINTLLELYNVGDWILARTRLDRYFGVLTITYGRKAA